MYSLFTQYIDFFIQSDTTYNVHILLKATSFGHEEHHQANFTKS